MGNRRKTHRSTESRIRRRRFRTANSRRNTESYTLRRNLRIANSRHSTSYRSVRRPESQRKCARMMRNGDGGDAGGRGHRLAEH